MMNKYQIYISYAKADNIASLQEGEGWIKEFRQFVSKTLSRLFENEIDIVMYSEEAGDTLPGLSQTDVFICVLSSAYLQSKTCLHHAEQIEDIVSQQRKESLRKPVIKVLKEYITSDTQPASLRFLPAYHLYPSNAVPNPVRIPADFTGKSIDKRVWLEMADLIYDIHEILTSYRFKDHILLVTEKVSGSGHAVYLAETEPGLLVERHIIKKELQKIGFTVLPEQRLPDNQKAMEAIIRKDLERCKMSIHLIGDSQEMINGTGSSFIELQNKLAVEHSRTKISLDSSKDPAFSRMIWVRPQNELFAHAKESLLEGLKRNLHITEGSGLFQNSLQSFTSVLKEELTELPSRNNSDVTARGIAYPEIYIIYDKPDSAEVEKIISLLQDRLVNLSQSIFSSDVLQVRTIHTDRLVTADIILLYSDKKNEQWLQMKALEVLKAPGYGRTKPVFAKAILTTPAINLNPEFYQSNGFSVITEWELYINNILARYTAQSQEKHGY